MNPAPTRTTQRAPRAPRRLVVLAGLAVAAALLAATPSLQPAAHAFPRPSLAPVSWEIDFVHRTPQRMVVDTAAGPRAFWYMIYTVTNNTDEERFFLPDIVLHTDDGRNLPANYNVPKEVYDRIRERTKSLRLVGPKDMYQRLLVGEDEAKSSMAVWAEPKVEIGTFDIFFAGLSGETLEVKNPATGEPLKDKDGSPILIRKTKQMIYKVRGDAVRPEEDSAVLVSEQWVMR